MLNPLWRRDQVIFENACSSTIKIRNVLQKLFHTIMRWYASRCSMCESYIMMSSFLPSSYDMTWNRQVSYSTLIPLSTKFMMLFAKWEDQEIKSWSGTFLFFFYIFRRKSCRGCQSEQKLPFYLYESSNHKVQNVHVVIWREKLVIFRFPAIFAPRFFFVKSQ